MELQDQARKRAVTHVWAAATVGLCIATQVAVSAEMHTLTPWHVEPLLVGSPITDGASVVWTYRNTPLEILSGGSS
ncbi:TPA: hypothetical protein ACH3X3_010797 [Trebouxia sp. C0006]